MTSPSIQAAHELVQALIGLGIREAVVAPGSRSAPLAYALAYAARSTTVTADSAGLRLHVRIDERDAGFLALGLAKGGDGTPVVVVTTSGTAVANLVPAAREAHHGGVPLLFLTADRPHELRGTGANQTADQVGLFGPATRLSVDVPAPTGRQGESRDVRALAARAVAAATGARGRSPGPVHLNLAYRDPLAPSVEDLDLLRGALLPGAGSPDSAERALTHVLAQVSAADDPAVVRLGLDSERATVVVAGDGAGPVARQLAEARGWPLLAEVSSGAAGGPTLVQAHRLVLAGSPLTTQIRQVIVFGRPTVSRPVQALLAGTAVRVVVIAPGAQPWPDAARNAAVVLDTVPATWLAARMDAPERSDASAPGPSGGESDSGLSPTRDVALDGWLAAWQRASSAAVAVVDATLVASDLGELQDGHDTSANRTLTSLDVAAAVAQAHQPGDVLVVGSSSPVRDLELVARWDEPGRVLANRGLAGIDGTVSTALGVALAVQRSGGYGTPVVRALLGDLTFLHDIGGLLAGPRDHPVQAQLVVVNDGGGAIFDTLEHGRFARGADEEASIVERVFGTPHRADLAALCAGYGVHHDRLSEWTQLAAILAHPPEGVSVIEVQVARHGRGDQGRQLAAAVAKAVGGSGNT